MKKELTIENLLKEAKKFVEIESKYSEPAIYGSTDGKAIGTYLEHKFVTYLDQKFTYLKGNSAKGVDLPSVEVDIKVTSINQPQSSSPFKSARQKIFGLGYSLLVFVYEKKDNHKTKTANLNFLHTVFVEKSKTSDFQTTSGLIKILENEGNKDDLIAFMLEKNLPIDDIEAEKIAEEILSKKIELGYLTISNALQWRLQYGRVIQKAGEIDGIIRIK